MKKLFLLLTLCAAVQMYAFEAKIIITRALNIEEQFMHILPQRPPFCPVLAKVEPKTPFKIYFLCLHPEIKDNQAAVSGKVTFIRPDKNTQSIDLKPVKFKVSGDQAGVLLLPGAIKAIMEEPPKDPYGQYTIQLELTDTNSKKTIKTSASFQYLKKIEPQKNANALKKLLNYYREPEAEYILDGFRELIKKQPEQKAKEKKNYNPLPQMALFYYLLKHNPQYIDHFADMVINQMNIDGRNLGATILYFLSPDNAQMLPQQFIEHCKKHFKTNPFEVEKPTLPYHLDILWSEFFVTGKKAPLLKIINAASLFEDAINVKDFQKIKNPTAADKRKLLNGLTAFAANWSANSLASQHQLINYYLEAAIVRKEIKDKFPVAVAVSLLKKQSNEKKSK